MGIFSKPVTACHGLRPSRAPLRKLLRRAAKGETDAYFALTSAYFDLVCEHLYLCNIDPPDALQQAEKILREGWRRLPYLKRLSDWERFIATHLMAIPVSAAYSPWGRRPQALIELDRNSKFALIAFDLENWSYRWLALSLRVPAKELQNILFEARCKLLEIDLAATPKKVRRCLALISADLDEQLTPCQQRQAVKKLRACDDTRAFKSRWLDHRCHLIDFRQQIRLQPRDRDAFLDGLCRDLVLEEMLRPTLLARFRNLISFQELPPRTIIPANGDFS